jgi:hypothetical protein
LPLGGQAGLGLRPRERFFEKIVDLCQEAGLVWERELSFDWTQVEANAGIRAYLPLTERCTVSGTLQVRSTTLMGESRPRKPSSIQRHHRPAPAIEIGISYGCLDGLLSA